MADISEPTPTVAKSPTKENEVIETTELDKVVTAEIPKPQIKERKIIHKITIEPDTDKAAKRKERFGGSDKETVEAKKTKRAARFGSGGGMEITTPEIEEKKKARAARFGKGIPATAEVEEKKKVRAARFGNTN